MLKYLLLAACFSIAFPLCAQEPPDFQENGRNIAIRMRNDGRLSMLVLLNGVDFIESEQKIIDGQPHRIASYRVRLSIKQPFCTFGQKNGLGLSLTNDLSLCVGTPYFYRPGENFQPTMQSIWKLTDQGWRLTQQQVVRVFP